MASNVITTLNRELEITSLRRRVLDISYKNNLSHLGSCLTVLPILTHIFRHKPEKFVLSCGHAGLALYVVLEAIHGINAEELYDKHGTHPCRDQYIDCSTGSLGMGLTVAVGLALAGKETYCVISDGECAEGCVWEALAFKTRSCMHSLHVHVNYNGYSAYGEIDYNLASRLRAFDPRIQIHYTNPGLPFLDGIDAHYHKMTKEEYETAIRR